MRINVATREVLCKVVYYGPGMSGKTTNLSYLHANAPRQSVGEMVTLDTHSERTLHFELLPMDMGTINGFQVRFEFYTVPGQSYYAATRRLVLEGADGVVFVADSRREALDENIDSMNDLLDNMRHHHLPEDLPVVMQYNKQDVSSALKPEQLEPLLNIRHWPRFAAVATAGNGVIDTMQAVAKMVIERISKKDLPTSTPSAPAPVQTAKASWLITCYRCLNMLEVVDAKAGDLFTCGSCGVPLEISDLEHGLTQQPPRPPATATAVGEESGYGMQPIQPNPSASALGTGTGPIPDVGNAIPFELDGYDQVALLDENIQGRRYKIRDRSNGNKERALVLSATLMRQPGYLAQIEPYARMASQIKHPNVLPLNSLRQGRETPILVSADPADHESLTHVLARRRVLAPPHAIGIIRQVALALEEAARFGVVHGWLRPDVILLSSNGGVLVDELGLPKNHRFLVRELSGASAATEYYLAPEHVSEETRSDVRSDIFMLGALLFRMITGEGLVTGYNAHEALHQISANGCRTMRMVQPNVSRDLDAFFQKMVGVERKDRFQTLREIIDILDKFGGGAKRPTLRLTGGHTKSQTGGIGATSRATRPVARNTANIIHRTGTGTALRTATQADGGARRRADASSNTGLYVVLGIVALCVLIGGLIALTPSSAKSFKTEGIVQPMSKPQPKPTTVANKPAPVPASSAVKSAPIAPVEPKVAEKPATPAPAPAATPKQDPGAVAAPSDANRGDLLLEISTLERAEKFKAAYDACDKLPDAEERVTRSNDVMLRHDQRKKELTDMAAAATSLTDIQAPLQTAIENWGLPGDAEWAQDLLAATRARLPADAKANPTAENPTISPPGPEAAADTPKPAAAPENEGEANWAADQALAHYQPAQAELTLINLPQDSREYKAVRRKIDIWHNRAEIIKGMLARNPKLRITHPSDHTDWDVTGAENEGLQVLSPGGSTTRIDWPQIPPKELARVCQEGAANGAGTPREHALAAVMLLISGDTALASVEVIKNKAALAEDVRADLDTMIALKRSRESAELIKQANEAANTGNLKAMGEFIDQLKRQDKSANPKLAEEVSALEAKYKSLQETKAAANVVKDELYFDSPDDINSFATHDGPWLIANGLLVCGGEKTKLERKDMALSRSFSMIFQTGQNKGVMVVNYRGAKVTLDFGKNSIAVSSKDQDVKPVEFPYTPNIALSLYMEPRPAIGQMSIELNNGVESFDLPCTNLTGTLSLSLDAGASVSFDEMIIARDGGPRAASGGAAGPGGGGAAESPSTAAIRSLGFEPIGGATLEAPAIKLPVLGCGIGIPLREQFSSVTFEVKGTGKLRMLIGILGSADGQYYDAELPADPNVSTKFTVGWLGNILSVRAEDGQILGSEKITGAPTHLMIMTLDSATILSTPRLNRQ